MTQHNLRPIEGHEYFTYNDELYLQRVRGEAQDSANQLGYDTPPRRKLEDWQKPGYGAKFARKLMAMDEDKPDHESGQGWDDEEEAEGKKFFGEDKWAAYRKARDKRRAAAKDTPPPSASNAKRPGIKDDLMTYSPERVQGGAAADANFIRRYPGTFRIGREDGYGRQTATPGRAMTAREEASFDQRFPDAKRIKVA